jgi:quinohemoprotein ethanol dehydrogenase
LSLLRITAFLLLLSAPSAHAIAAPDADGSWPLNGLTFDGARHSPLRQIDTTNVQRLGFAWEFRDFLVRGRTHRGMEANPLVLEGVMYFSGPWGVAYALDARSGRLLWRYDPKADGQFGRSACCDVVSRGLAVWGGRVFTASLDGYLIALDARTGKPLWRIDTFVNRHWNYTITGAPYIAGENVIIGNAGAEMGARGYVSAYNLESGKLAWRFWTVPGDPRKGPDESADVTRARRTWAADTHWELGGGGAVWDSMAYDPEAQLVYFGTGNGDPHPQWLRSPGGGDNLYVCSLVAVDAKTGRMKWYYQEAPGDSWDFDATTPMVLAQLNWHGQVRHVLMQAAKNGLFYVLDRRTGELLKADAFTFVNWTDGVDLKSGRPHLTPRANYEQAAKIIWPSPAGGHGWAPIAYSPETGLVYLQVYEAPIRMHADPSATFMPGFMNQAEWGEFPPYSDADSKKQLQGEPTPRIESHLKAWDPVHARMVWEAGPLPFSSGGTLSTAGGLVFQGAADGVFSAYDARTGQVLKRITTGTVIMPAPITYELDGVQYIALMAGAGGPQGARYGPDTAASQYQNFERLMVFKLDGAPTPLPPKASVPALEPLPAAIAADATTLTRGETLFHEQCARCHVVGGAFGAFPNLWNLPPATLSAFDQIVLGGVFRDGGMASFADVLKPADTAAIKVYIITDERRRRAGQPAAASSSAAVR